MSWAGPHTDGSGPTPAELDRATAEITELLSELLGEDVVMAIGVEPESSLVADLELESIEFVALAEMISERYGEEVDFVAWMADMDIDDITGLTVGALAAFVAGGQRA
jgi:acyl carrier protein